MTTSPSRLALLAPRPLRVRLWQAGGLMLVALLTLLAANVLTGGVTRGMLGHDFLAFYSAGTFVNEGRVDRLYDLGALHAHQQSVVLSAGLVDAKDLAPWWNPPHVALLFAPLARLPFNNALLVWTCFNALCVMAAATILMQFIPRRDSHTSVRAFDDRDAAAGEGSNLLGIASSVGAHGEDEAPSGAPIASGSTSEDARTLARSNEHPLQHLPPRALIFLLLLAAFPTLHFLGHGQNTGLSLLLLSGVAAAFVAHRPVVAGALVALLAYKPQHAALLSVGLAVLMGWRVLGGLIVAGLPQLLATVLLMPGALQDWLHKVPLNLHVIQFEQPYLWDRHVTLLAFWRLAFQGSAVGIHDPVTSIMTTLSTIGVLGVLLMKWTQMRRRAISRTGWLALVLLATPLVMPFYFDYDLLLLAVPATLVAGEALRRGTITRGERIFAGLGLLLMVWSFLNVHFAAMTHLNGSVVLVLGLTLTLATSSRPAAAASGAGHEPMLGFEDLQQPLRAA